MNDAWVLAHCVKFGELEGNEFDWTSMTWRQKD